MVAMDLRWISISISMISFLMNLLVLFLLFWKGGRSRHTYLWASLVGLLTLWCVSEIFIKSADDTATAINWFRLVLVSGGFIPPLLLNFALEFPHRHDIIRKRFYRLVFYIFVYVPNIILLIKAEITSIYITKVVEPVSIWGTMYTRDSLIIATAPDVYFPHYIFLISLIFIAIFFIFQNLKDTKSKTEKKQLEIIAWALSVMFIPGVIFDAVLSMVFGIYTEIFSLMVSILAILTVYAVVKYKFLVISPRSEEFTFDPGDVALPEPGYAYIVPESARDTGIKMFRYALSQKRDGIVITNKDPTDIRVDLGIKKTPIIYLGQKTNNEFRIDPDNLDSLVGSLTTFTRMTKNPVLLVDWDERPTDGSQEGTINGSTRELQPAMTALAAWFSGDEIGDTIEEASKILTGGSSIVIFQKMQSKDIIKTQRPTQHINFINILLIKNLLDRCLMEVESNQGDPRIVLKELGVADKFFEGWNYMERSVMVPLNKQGYMDRPTTITKLRTIQLVLSRSTLKGVSVAMDKIWKEANLGGYMIEEIAMPEGTVHFLASEDQTKAFNIAREIIAAGYQGLCISTRPPDKIKHQYGLSNVDYKWITTSKTDDKRAIPVSLEHIMRDVRDYITIHNESLVILDGIELLISRLGFENVQRFLHVLKDEIAVSKTLFMIPVDPKAIDAQRLALLKREVEV